ncbi:hypothetical protein PAMA_012390 [Pampus argenteus]
MNTGRGKGREGKIGSERMTSSLATSHRDGTTVAADSPQVFESSPQEDYEETPKESDHGGGEESPPHPLAITVTGHVWRKWDDHIHLGYVDGRIRVEFLPGFRHYRFLVICQPPDNQLHWDSGALGRSSQRPLTPQRFSHVESTTSESSAFSSGFTLRGKVPPAACYIHLLEDGIADLQVAGEEHP